MQSNEFDVVVLGTGAAGMVAALAAHDAGARVGLFEKADVIGGTTALSGGVCWLPCNPLAAKAGLQDSREDALLYLRSLSHGLISEDLAEALVDGTVPVIEYLESRTPLRFQLLRIPDYHAERPGGKPLGGRSIEPTTTAFDDLGDWAPRIGIGQFSDPVTGDVYLTTLDSPRGGGSGRIDDAELARRRKHKVNGRGRGMIGGLLKACLERGFEPVTVRARHGAADRQRQGGRRAHASAGSGIEEVRARGGVVLATGGFEWNKELAVNFLRGPMQHPASIPTNTGDGLKMAMRVGAQLGNMREAWWMPAAKIPGVQQYGEQKVALILRERALPGTIMVNRRGRRFVNEATNYNAIAGAFHHLDPSQFDYGNLPCWIIFDSQMARSYGFLDVPIGGDHAGLGTPRAPRWRRWQRRSVSTRPAWMRHRGALERPMPQAAHDPDFGRGNSAYDGFNGDITRYPAKSATIGAIGAPPPTTRCSWRAARWAPKAARAPTATAPCSTWTAASSPACMPRAM
jgi:3-oxosteroid 1-dehydrogenase